MIAILILLLFHKLNADVLFNESEPQLTKPDSQNEKPESTKDAQGSSNLPSYYRKNRSYGSLDPKSILPNKDAKSDLQLLPGNEVPASIIHSILALPNFDTPVVATILSGKFQNFHLLGTAKLESNSKKVFISFTYISSTQKTYELEASAINEAGFPGFEGEYHSRELEYFGTNFLSTFTGAYFDSLIHRKRDFFGNQTQEPSVDTGVKAGASASSIELANNFKDKLKNTPEFSEIKGPVNITILIKQQPKEK